MDRMGYLSTSIWILIKERHSHIYTFCFIHNNQSMVTDTDAHTLTFLFHRLSISRWQTQTSVKK